MKKLTWQKCIIKKKEYNSIDECINKKKNTPDGKMY